MSDEQAGSDQPFEAAVALRGDPDHGDGVLGEAFRVSVDRHLVAPGAIRAGSVSQASAGHGLRFGVAGAGEL